MSSQDIAAGVRTVCHAAKYFDELRDAAIALAERRAASARGYFTPTEEDEVRALLISYWQARNALLELVASLQLEEERSPEERSATFLIGFAGALVLVDAARFLRETVHDRPLVRQKLNEPAPAFGIPAGVYDTVQQSLVSARNAWRLYEAARFFEVHQAELRSLAADEPLAPVMAVIERLRHRLNVSVAQYARARLRARASQALCLVLRDGVGQALYNLQKLGGNMLSDKYLRIGHQPHLPAAIAERVRALLIPGDVLVVRKEHALTNYFLPGFWPHSALYLGDAACLKRMALDQHDHVRPRWGKVAALAGEPGCVLESMKDGVQIRSLGSPFGSDSIVVLRPRLAPEAVAQAFARAMIHEGKPYDFDFDFRRSDRLVCTEVIYRAYDGIGSMRFPLTLRAGRPTLSGSDLIGLGLQRTQLDPIAVYVPGGEFVTGHGVDAILRARQGAAAPPELAASG